VTRQVKKNDPVPTMVREVLGYFLRHPQAADTLEGVARWRLQAETVERTVDEIQEALRWLVQLGFLCEHRTPGSAPIFTLEKSRTPEAEQLLSEVEAKKE
jgi:hypothetical protein